MSSDALATARIQELRCKILSLLDQARPDSVAESLLLRGLQVYRPTLQDLQKEVGYLAQRQLISLEPVGNDRKAALLALGVDLLESTVQIPGIDCPPELLVGAMEFARRLEVRWRLIAAVDSSRPISLLMSLAQRILHDAYLPVTDRDLSRIANYLRDKGLVTIKPERGNDYSLELTADGIDVATYLAPCPVGVGRPEKYW